MKLPELKTKFKNKYVIRIIAGVLVVAMVGTGVSVSSVYAAKNTSTKAATESVAEDTEGTEGKEDVAEEDSEDVEESLKSTIKNSITINEKEIGKEETVYIIADSAGTPKETIVSDHLINNDDKETLEDASNLKDIKNVKGDETFSQNGNKLTWNAGGNDIYYQGTSTEEAPITETITYYLDGKKITPEALAGKSGKVTVRFDYTNNEMVETEIEGKKTRVCVPFMAISGMVLDDSFSDIQVTNGKVVADGNTNVVVGYTLPGLKSSLDVEDKDFDSKLSIPDYFEFTANVENFELGMTMTAVVNATNFVSAQGEDSFSSVGDLLDTLTDATSQLQDGSATLAEGVDTLKSKMGEFSSGVGTLQDGIQKYTDGAATVAVGIGSLKSGINSLTDGVPALTSGVQQLKDGSASALDGATQLKGAADQLATGAGTLNTSVGTLVDTVTGMGTTLDASKTDAKTEFESKAGMTYDQATAMVTQLQQNQTDLINGIVATAGAGGDATALVTQLATVNATLSQLQTGIAQVNGANLALDGVKAKLSTPEMLNNLNALKSGAGDLSANMTTFASKMGELSTGLTTLDAGLGELNQKAGALGTGATQLKNGVNQLANGASELVSNNASLKDGAAKLADGTGALTDGVNQLDDGAHELADGIVTFNEEGIEKILNSYTGDLEPLMERIQAILDAGTDYQSYTDIAKGVNGSVKFIYKTDAIKAED